MAYNRRSSRKGVYRKPWPIRSRKRWVATKTAAAGVTVTPGTAALTLTAFAPTVLTPRLVTPATAALTITRFAPTVSAPRLVTPATASLTLTVFAPTVSTPRLVTPGIAALTITAFAPSVTTPRLVTPATASLTLTRFAPTVSVPRLVTPGTASLTLTAFAPTVTAVGSDPHPIHRRRGRVHISPPHRKRIRARVDSEILVVSDLRPRVEERRVLVPSRASSQFELEVVGSAKPHVWHRRMVESDIDLPVVGMMRASIDNEAEVVGLALGVSAEIALELV